MSLSEDISVIRTDQLRDTARRTLAMRIAHRNRLRAERLARLQVPPEADKIETVPASDDVKAVPEAVGVQLQPRADNVEVLADVGRVPVMSGVAERPPLRQVVEPGFEKPALVTDFTGHPAPSPIGDEGGALEEFLRALSGVVANPVVAEEPGPAAILQFQQPESWPQQTGPDDFPEPLAAPVCDLERLEGAGTGLIWVLQRAGIACLADLARLEAEELVSQLGPLGRLIPASDWLATARQATVVS